MHIVHFTIQSTTYGTHYKLQFLLKHFSETGIIKMIEILIDKIFVMFGGHVL